MLLFMLWRAILLRLRSEELTEEISPVMPLPAEAIEPLTEISQPILVEMEWDYSVPASVAEADTAPVSEAI